MIRRPPISTPFPYPTIFRSVSAKTPDVVEGVAEPGQHVAAVLAEKRRDAANGRPDAIPGDRQADALVGGQDRKSTRLNSSHGYNSDAAFLLQKQTYATPALS